MKIEHDGEQYGFLLDDGTESELEDFGVPNIMCEDGRFYMAYLVAPGKGADGLDPVVYTLEPNPTSVERAEFEDEPEDGDLDPDDEDLEETEDNELETL